MSFEGLTHFQKLDTRLRQWYNTLREYCAHHHIWIPSEVSEIRKDVFGEERCIGRSDGGDKQDLGESAAH